MKSSKALKVFCILIGLSFFFPIGLSQASQTAGNQAKIGVFYYVWWDPTNPSSWDYSVVDTPVLGFYSSNNSTIISEQLSAIEEAGIDFVLVSWWGIHDGFGRFTDLSAKQVFQVAANSQTRLKFAVLVEPFDPEYERYDYDAIYEYDYDAIYDQIYYNFFLPYSSLYYYEDGSPLICFYNDPGPAPSLTESEFMTFDSRFTCKIIGEEPYTHWMYLDLVRQVVRENEVSVTPRYDESRLADRQMGIQIDSQLDQGVYDYEWEKAIQLWQQGQVKTILISSWNEYYERTAIEPHFDATAVNEDPYFLYNKTKTYIDQLRNLSEQPQSPDIIPEYPSALPWFALLITVTTSISAFKLRHRKQEGPF